MTQGWALWLPQHLPPRLPGKWSWLLPQGHTHLLEPPFPGQGLPDISSSSENATVLPAPGEGGEGQERQRPRGDFWKSPGWRQGMRSKETR